MKIDKKRYYDLTVLGEEKTEKGERKIKVRCMCGNTKFVNKYQLSIGGIKSCGCYIRRSGGNNKKHGASKTRLFKIWSNMKGRCHNPNNQAYEYYGGRGIKVCDEWMESFETFNYWALSNGYKDNLTIERKDVNAGYHPKNCKWVTLDEQANNKTTSKYITYKGKTKTVADWAKEIGLDAHVIYDRLRAGWDSEKTLTTPIRKNKTGNKIEFNDESLTIAEWSKKTGISQKAISDRLLRGFSVEKALTQPLQKRRKSNANKDK